MAAPTEGVPLAVGNRLAAFQEAIHHQRPINPPAPPQSAADSELGKRKRDRDDGYDEELERDRYINDMKLKSRFEHIFSKYGKDFTDVGDEVDLFTGKVVIDNGHLQHMRTDLDLGGEHRGRLSEMLDSDLSDTDGESYNQSWDQSAREEPDEDDVDDDFAKEQDELGEVEDTADEDSFNDSEDELSDGDNSMMTDHDHVSNNDSGYTMSKSAGNDVWNDAPRLPGDIGYDPFASSTGRPGVSGTALKKFESDVSDQITQLVGALQKAQDPVHLKAQAKAGLKPQITIDLDPTSANYGKPVITYVPMDGPSGNPAPAAAASGFFAELQRQSDLPPSDEVLKRPRDVAANVLARIVDAGLPTVPGPDGKFPPYRSKRNEAPGRYNTTSISGDNADMAGLSRAAIPIDPVLQAATATEIQAEVAVASDNGQRDTPDTEYSANTARTLEKKLLPPGVPFSEEDDELILELKDNRCMLWDDIRDLCFPNRRITALQYRYYTYLKSDCRKDLTEEDEKLIVRLKEVESMSWPNIQRKYFSEFRVNQLQYRYYSKLCRVQKTEWTSEEAEMLANLKDQQGLTWQQIKERHFPERSVGQIQYRYYKSGRPADWKEQLAALAEAYEQTDGDGEQEALTASGLRPAKEGTLIWGVRRRLAAASKKLTAKKHEHFAAKKKKLEEQRRLEALRLLAQEEKRKKREAQNIAKLNLIRAEQDDIRSKVRIERRDIASLSPEQEAVVETTPPIDPVRSSLEREMYQQHLRQQFEAAITKQEEREDQQLAAKRRVSARSQDLEEKRRGDRQLFQQAVQIGPMLLPKVASAVPPPVAPQGLMCSVSEAPVHHARGYSSPYPCLLPGSVHGSLRGPTQSTNLSLGPHDTQTLAHSPLPRTASSVSPMLATQGPSLPTLAPGTSALRVAPETSRSSSCDSRLQTHDHVILAPQPAQEQGPTGPSSRQWSLPKLHQPLLKGRTTTTAPKPASDATKPKRRTAKVIIPFPSRSPVQAHATPRNGRSKTVGTGTAAALSTALASNHNDRQYGSETTPDVGSHTNLIVTTGTIEPSGTSPSSTFTSAFGSRETSTAEVNSATDAVQANTSLNVNAGRRVTNDLPTNSVAYSTSAELSNLNSLYATAPTIPPDSPNRNVAPMEKTVRSATASELKRIKRERRVSRKTAVISDSESDAPSSINLLSDDNDDSSVQEVSDSDVEDERTYAKPKKIERLASEIESDDELNGQREMLNNRLLSVRASLPMVEKPLPRKVTPQKRIPRKEVHRRSAPAKTWRALMSAAAVAAQAADPADDDDELA